MPRTLDRDRDFAEILGGRKLFCQDGFLFLPNGEEFTDSVINPGDESEVPPAGTDINPDRDRSGPHLEPAQSEPEPVLTKSGEPAKVDPDDMRLANNRALKVQMEAFGQEWKGVAHARKYLGIDQ